MFVVLKNVKRHLKEFCNQTALHGPAYIVEEGRMKFEQIAWIGTFIFGILYGWLLYSTVLEAWYYEPTVNAIDQHDFPVEKLPFPAITICSNNKIVYRQLESVLRTQPWKGLNKSIANFEVDFNSALTALVLAQDDPYKLRGLTKGTISILNNYYLELPEILKQVMQTCDDDDFGMFLECYWYGIKYDCSDLFKLRPTDNGFCCSFNTLAIEEQFIGGSSLIGGIENVYHDPCQDWLDLINMKLTSPNYPEPYKPLEHCNWKITAPLGHYVTLEFHKIDFSEHYDGDLITIFNVDKDGSQNLIARLSGPDMGPMSFRYGSNWEKKVISTSSNNMVVNFKSDNEALEFTGFSATIHFTLMQNKKCESWRDMNNGILETPNYPNSYGNDIFCNHLITVNPGFHIILDFHEFDLENNKDFFYIYEGGSKRGKMIANMTGKENNTQISIPRSQMFVVFNTNGDNGGKGFHAKILKIDMCQFWFNKSSGVISNWYYTSNFPYYSHNLNCTWMIDAYDGYYTVVRIFYFKLIQGDILSVYDEQDDTRTKIAELDFNFNDKQKTFSSYVGHSLLIHFSSDHKSTWFGFQAHLHYVPSNVNCADYLDKNKLILNELAIACNWIITAPSVTSIITIQIQYIEFEYSTLTIYNGGDNNDEALWPMANDFLSGFLSTSIKSSGNQIFIESKNYAYGSELNFSASFTFDDICADALDLSKGTLNIDNSLEFGTHCKWLLPIVDDSYYITLEFQDYDIKFGKNQLAIFDGPNRAAMKIGEVYGLKDANKKWKSISSSGMMFIEFEKKVFRNEFNEKTELMALIKYNKFLPKCQTWLDIERNTLMSPETYEDNVNCSWLLSTDFGSYIILHFDHLHLDNELLRIYDGGSEYSDLIVNITANAQIQTEVSSMRNQMFVVYEKISKDLKMGAFRASFEKIDDNCQYWLNKMTLTSPYYPKYYLADGKGCQWIITAPVGHVVALEFEEFNLPPNGYYNLLLYDGVCDLARKIDTLTGDMDFMEDSLVLSSSGHNMFVSFDVGNYGPWKGFTAKIHYVKCAEVKRGEIGFCACNQDVEPCSDNEGDCDFDNQCQQGLRCRPNSCPTSLGYDSNTDCCLTANVGDENFCTIDEPCEVGEGDCDGNDECRGDDLICGLKNCPDNSADCCEPADSCKMNYCQDGIQVYYKTERQEYNYKPIYGHYRIDPSDVNGRPYLNNEIEDMGIWWSNGYWLMGDNEAKGQTAGIAYYSTDIFCPYHLIMLPRPWMLFNPSIGWFKAHKQLHLKCDFGECTSSNPCGEDEGDCDNDDQCKENHKCGTDNCRSSLGYHSQFDCCYNEVEDFCTTDNLCGLLEGDCDSHYVCQEGLLCGLNNCPEDFDNTTDCCYLPVTGDEDFCSSEIPCGEDEGDCDNDDQCKENHKCGTNNCRSSLDFHSQIDCCLDVVEDFCTIFHPCGVSEGDCDSHDVCQTGLLCGLDNCPDNFDNTTDCCFVDVTKICEHVSWINDNYCDDDNNNVECEWDGGDCCGSNVNTLFCSACECLDPDPEIEHFCSTENPCKGDEGDCDSDDECQGNFKCGTNNCPKALALDPEVDCCVELKDECVNFGDFWGDSICDDVLNNDLCKWDGGDCCLDDINSNYCLACECLGPNANISRKQSRKSPRENITKYQGLLETSNRMLKLGHLDFEFEDELLLISGSHIMKRSRAKRNFKQQMANIGKINGNQITEPKSNCDDKKTTYKNSSIVCNHLASSVEGLIVVLNPNEPEYKTDAVKNNFVGFKTLVHSPYDFPEVEAVGMAVNQNIRSYIGIRGYHSWITEDADGWKPDQKKCASRDDIDLNVFEDYTRKNCVFECQAKEFFDQCGCLPYHYPNFHLAWEGINTTACNFTGLLCLSNVSENSTCPLMCPGDCTLTRFNYVLSTAPRSHIDTILHSTSLSKKNYLLYNLTQNIKMLDDICISHAEKEQRIKELKQLNHSITYASSTLHFFWQHENMLSYKRDQVYDLWDMIANFGGMMGCAIGMSMMAAFEIVYWIFVKPFMKIKDKPNPSPAQRRFSKLLHISGFAAVIIYAGYRFNLVHQLMLEKWNLWF